MACVYVYGFAPGTTEEDFCSEFFADFDQDEICHRIDFKGDKIFAFIHVHTEQQANDLIENWNGQKMSNSKFGLQVRMKGQNNHVKPREPNLFIYGFPKSLSKEDFQEEFFLKFPEVWEGCVKVDFLGEKLQAFIHCADTTHCDQLIKHWDGRPMQNSNKPLQVRYKGDNLEQNRIHKMSPVLYVYGFPKGMTEEMFREEFFLKFPQYEQKIDFHGAKIYAFVHCHNVQQCQELKQHWDGNKFQNSVKPLQVSMRDMHQARNKDNNMQNGGMMGGMQMQGMMGGPRGRFMNPQMGMMVPPQYTPMMVPQMQQAMAMNWGGMNMQPAGAMNMGYQQPMNPGMMMNGQNNKRQMPNGQFNQNGGFQQQGNQGLMQMPQQNGNMGNRPQQARNGPNNGPQNKRIKMQNGNMKMENQQQQGFQGQNFQGQPQQQQQGFYGGNPGYQNPNQFNQGDGAGYGMNQQQVQQGW